MTGDANDIDAAVDVRIRRRRPRRLIENLHRDMTAGTLVDVLQHLRFIDDRSVVRLDKGVRDFIVRALQSR
jgi:hypothetical protein